ncbi:PREDICTED: activating signal cointegrator 1 complex subunit 2 [Habropoda laboriosa]|uniref:activating signal cointegrator 1 complex subunit 2 n=1 Tax=Habropoda laboriosa TaxID=597456 RepID=UPI00083E3FBA|nr:PREDICTED: activating signal cointegrator 1 complex subunit 2 [Habropoda laboriosa]
MENVSHENMESFENPDLLPLENLKLKIKTDGVVKIVDALSKTWASDRYFLHYEAPSLYTDDGNEIVGAKEHWMAVVNYMINDFRWLLSLPFYRFWSNIIFNASILDALVSFLQEAPPFYALENFATCPEMLKLLDTLSHYVLVVFTRLITNKESPEEFMSQPFFGNLLYENYIFTVPIIFDLCQLYGRENEKIMKKILNCLFTLEPQYNNDLEKAVPCMIEALENVERRFDNCPTRYSNEAVSLSERDTGTIKLTLFNLEDMILYVLDISSTITVFLKNYSSAVNMFHREDFMSKIVLIYESTIPEMYKTLDKLAYNDTNMPKYMELKHRLDVTRIEILNLFRIILYEPILNIQENLSTIKEAEIKERVDEYFNLLTIAIAEKEFITDYDQFYPVETDMRVLLNICPEIDMIKCNYILQSMGANIGKPSASSASFSDDVNEPVAGPSGISSRTTFEDTNSSETKGTSTMKNSVDSVSIISDMLCIQDKHFIEMCLEYYNNNSTAVIDAIIGDTLPPKLKKLKDLGSSEMSSTPPAYAETSVNQNLTGSIRRLNILDNDGDVHVKPREVIEVPKDYIIQNYSLVDVYEDEYDDTYEDECDDTLHDRGVRYNTEDLPSAFDPERSTIPRFYYGRKADSESEDENVGDENTESEQNKKDHFVENPADVRARAEQRRQAMRGRKGGAPPNVIGKQKGRGQDKSVLQSRQQKNTDKAKRANHNRRSGSQWKRNQGMIPS